MKKMSKILIGRVESFDGRYYKVICAGESGHLRWHSLIASQLKGAKIGDTVELRYFSNARMGYWHVSEVKK